MWNPVTRDMDVFADSVRLQSQSQGGSDPTHDSDISHWLFEDNNLDVTPQPNKGRMMAAFPVPVTPVHGTLPAILFGVAPNLVEHNTSAAV